MVHACELNSTQEAEAEDGKFETSLGNTVHSGWAGLQHATMSQSVNQLEQGFINQPREQGFTNQPSEQGFTN